MLANISVERQSERFEEHSIIFVAHGIGGILVKRVLELSQGITAAKGNGNLRSIYVSTYGIIFL
jgi:predicted alpha/beta hydrolase family esterase